MFVFRMLAPREMLDEELVKEYMSRQKAFQLPQQTDSGIRSRRAELSRMTPTRLVEGEKRQMSTGGVGRTWRTPEAREPRQ